jgi:hypothetical protein
VVNTEKATFFFLYGQSIHKLLYNIYVPNEKKDLMSELKEAFEGWGCDISYRQAASTTVENTGNRFTFKNEYKGAPKREVVLSPMDVIYYKAAFNKSIESMYKEDSKKCIESMDYDSFEEDKDENMASFKP